MYPTKTTWVETCLTRVASDLTRRKAIPIQLVRELPTRSPCLLPPFPCPPKAKLHPPGPTGGLGGYSTVMCSSNFPGSLQSAWRGSAAANKISVKRSDFHGFCKCGRRCIQRCLQRCQFTSIHILYNDIWPNNHDGSPPQPRAIPYDSMNGRSIKRTLKAVRFAQNPNCNKHRNEFS
jgi:hypothetical protein